MRISILLPYKENYSPDYPGAVSLFVKSTSVISKYKDQITVFGSTSHKKKLSGNYINNKLTLGIRPELISINPRKSKSADFIEGEIEEISYLGETTYYKIICGKDIEPLNVSTQNSFGQMNYKVGEKVKLNIDKDNIVGFSG